jgi:FkbM family methyltransferase
MKIAWFTPYNQKSAIGRFSSSASTALAARGHQIALVSSDQDLQTVDAHPPEGVQLFHWPQFENGTWVTNNFDVFVYNIGDNFRNHFGVLQLIDRFPGVGIFHDCSLVNLFLQWSETVDKSTLDRVLSSNYGEQTAIDFWAKVRQTNFADAKDHCDFLDWSASCVPMTGWLARKCIAAIAHAPFYKSRLAESCPGPVAVIPLAFKRLATDRPAITIKHRDDRMHILTVGRIDSSKRVESVIEAIANSPILRSGCEYNIAGFIDPKYRTTIQSLIDRLGLGKSVCLHGEVSDFELHWRFIEADIVCCLRWPTFNGASASCIEAMSYGKPVIVTDVGFYSSIPSDRVLKVRPIHESQDLRQHLEMLVPDVASRETLGKLAQQWADAEHAPEMYAERIEPLVDAAVEQSPQFDALNQLGRSLQIVGVNEQDSLVERIGSEFQLLFLGDQPGNIESPSIGNRIRPTTAIRNVLSEHLSDHLMSRASESRDRDEGKTQKDPIQTRARKLLWRLGVLCTNPVLSRLRSYFVEPLYNLGRSGDEHLSKVERIVHGILESNKGLGESISGIRGVINDVKQSVHRHDEYGRLWIDLQTQLLTLATDIDSLRSRLDSSHQLIAAVANRNVMVLGTELLARTPHGYILAPADDAAFACILAEGRSWEAATSKLLDLVLKDGMTFVDIGAHVGIQTIQAGRLVGTNGRVIAFEPTPTLFNLLQKSIRLNGLENVCSCTNMAISSHEGVGTLHLSDIYGHSSLYPLVHEKDTLPVKVSTLDNLLRDSARIDVVKIDVEGAELEVLAGMQQIIANHPEILLIVEYGVPHLERARVSSSKWFDSFFDHGLDLFILDAKESGWRCVAKQDAAQLPSANLVFVRPNTVLWTLLKQYET